RDFPVGEGCLPWRQIVLLDNYDRRHFLVARIAHGELALSEPPRKCEPRQRGWRRGKHDRPGSALRSAIPRGKFASDSKHLHVLQGQRAFALFFPLAAKARLLAMAPA